MLVTSKGKNALRIMLNLSLHKEHGCVKLKDIALEEGLSEKYLELIIPYLLKAGKVKSTRGTNGGYQLVKEPKDYTVGEIIKCLDGDLAPAECARADGVRCEKIESCFYYPLWKKLNQALNEVLEQTTLQNLIEWRENAEPIDRVSPK